MITAPNDWDIKRCLLLALAILLSLLGLIGMGYLGFDIPLLRQIVGFIFLTFIPGMFILRVFRIHNIGLIESLLYSVALSIAFIYFTGLFANFVLPLLDISKPISLLPITAILIIFTFILGLLAYKRDKGFSPLPGNLSIKDIPLSFYLLLLLLPLLTVLGTQLVNAYQNNIVLLFLLGLIACIVGLVSFRQLPEEAYSLTIIMISISLLFFVSLISPQLWIHDIHRQYYFEHIVLNYGYWESSIRDNYNTCLSLVMLCPIYSLITGMSDVWVFKIILPLITSLMPAALFMTFSYQIEIKKAFLATFFFIAVPGGLIGWECSPGREAPAKLFIILLVLLMIDKQLDNFKKTVLSIIFSISLILTHYSSAYIYMAFLGIGWLLLQLIKHNNLLQRLYCLSDNYTAQRSLLNSGIILLLFIFGLTWYMNVANASAFEAVVNIGNTVYSSLTEFFSPAGREQAVLTGLGMGFFEANTLSKFFRILQYTTELLIVVGFITLLLKPQRSHFQIEFFSLSIGAALLLFLSIFVPGFSIHLGFRRIYNFALLFLAPFCILGVEVITNIIFKSIYKFISKNSLTIRKLTLNINNNLHPLQILTLIVLIPYFLFTSGFIPTIIGSYSESQTLNSASIVLGPYRTDRWIFSKQEISAANILWKNLPNNSVVYADLYGASLLWQQLYGKALGIPPSGDIPKDAYIFLRKWNLEHNEVVVTLDYAFGAHVNLINRPKLSKRLEDSEVIYNNGGSKILAPKDQKGEII